MSDEIYLYGFEEDEDSGRMREYRMHNVALCDARHPILDVTDSVFPQVVENPLDFYNHQKVVRAWLERHQAFLLETHDRELRNRVNLYVSGLTPCLVAFLQEWRDDAELYLMHWDRDTDKYVECFWYC